LGLEGVLIARILAAVFRGACVLLAVRKHFFEGYKELLTFVCKSLTSVVILMTAFSIIDSMWAGNASLIMAAELALLAMQCTAVFLWLRRHPLFQES
jgi:hypothetical protein